MKYNLQSYKNNLKNCKTMQVFFQIQPFFHRHYSLKPYIFKKLLYSNKSKNALNTISILYAIFSLIILNTY